MSNSPTKECNQCSAHGITCRTRELSYEWDVLKYLYDYFLANPTIIYLDGNEVLDSPDSIEECDAYNNDSKRLPHVARIKKIVKDNKITATIFRR